MITNLILLDIDPGLLEAAFYVLLALLIWTISKIVQLIQDISREVPTDDHRKSNRRG